MDDFGVILCYSFVSYLYVSFSGLITSVGELIVLLSITRNYVVSVRRCFLFLLVLRIGCANLLWHSLCLPYNYLLYLLIIIHQFVLKLIFQFGLTAVFVSVPGHSSPFTL